MQTESLADAFTEENSTRVLKTYAGHSLHAMGIHFSCPALGILWRSMILLA